MIFFLVIIAIVLIVAAIRDTQGDLFSTIGTDVKDFSIWAGAIVAIGMIGFIPGLRPVSRALLGLVVVVLFVNNYQAIVSGFQKAWSGESE